MNKFSLLFACIFCLGAFFSSGTFSDGIMSNPLGQWRTIDDETGNAKSIIEIYSDKDEFKGKIVELINPSEANPSCNKCKGERAGKPIMGMTILWGVKLLKENSWGGGEILDPKKGKVYKVKFSLRNKGEELKLRGYVGTPMLGRTQIWQRVK